MNWVISFVYRLARGNSLAMLKIRACVLSDLCLTQFCAFMLVVEEWKHVISLFFNVISTLGKVAPHLFRLFFFSFDLMSAPGITEFEYEPADIYFYGSMRLLCISGKLSRIFTGLKSFQQWHEYIQTLSPHNPSIH